MDHATPRQDDTDREPIPVEDTASAAGAQVLRRTRKRGTLSDAPSEQGDVLAGRSRAAFRGKAFHTLLRNDPVVARAVAELVSRGAVTGARSRKVSARVDPGLMAAAKQRFGLTSEADVINASLAVAAAPDRFKEWLRNPQHTLTDDFELAV